MRMVTFGIAAAALSLSRTLPAAGEPTAADAKVKRGEYLVAIMDCSGCHTPGALIGRPDPNRRLAGSDVGFQISELGVFYPPNLTPDRDTGLGAWSEADIIKAVRTGERPDGRLLVPVMPYHSYAKLTDDDAAALASYLRTLEPVHNRVPAMTGPTEKPTAPYLGVVKPE
ncbi:MAG: c-type cytochrome [Xanthobacteraceae bacterium]